MKTIEIVTLFVDLALKYEWSRVKELTNDEVQVLFETISAAGFEPQKVALGKLVGNYLDQDGSRTGETYPINDTCPYKVVSLEGKDHYHATGWLNYILRLLVAQREMDRQQHIKAIQYEIERSIPLKPIQLTLEGDLLSEYPPLSGYLVDHTKDDHELSCCVGVHNYCYGWMDRTGATKMHDAIVCRRCHLRVLFPKNIKTYGELRQTLASRFVQAPA